MFRSCCYGSRCEGYFSIIVCVLTRRSSAHSIYLVNLSCVLEYVCFNHASQIQMSQYWIQTKFDNQGTCGKVLDNFKICCWFEQNTKNHQVYTIRHAMFVYLEWVCSVYRWNIFCIYYVSFNSFDIQFDCTETKFINLTSTFSCRSIQGLIDVKHFGFGEYLST